MTTTTTKATLPLLLQLLLLLVTRKQFRLFSSLSSLFEMLAAACGSETQRGSHNGELGPL